MGLIDRARNLIVTPKTEWEAIAADATPTPKIVTGYVLPLAAVAAVASFIGVVFIGTSMGMFGTVRLGLGSGLVSLVTNLVMAVVMVFVLGFIIDALAPTFGGQKSMDQAVKVAAYSYTPVWVLGILAVIPMLGMLAALIGAVYAIYLLYLGLPRLMRAPQEKAVGYTVVVIIAAIVVGVVIAMVTGGIMAMLAPTATFGTSSSSVTFDKDSPAGKFDEMARKMEDASRRMEEAQKSGDAGKQAQAAMAALGTALSGGKGVEPVQLDALEPFVPEQFAGLKRTDMRSDRSGVAGLMAAKVEARYGEGEKTVQLEVTDTGGAAGLMGLAGWAAVGATTESEDSDRVERMRREGKRLVREEISKRGGTNTYSVILADRFVVQAEGKGGIGIDALKSAVNSLDLARLETLR